MRFVTLFPEAENIHLTKDVGAIPYTLHRDYEVDSSIVCFENGSYDYLDAYVKGLQVEFLDAGNEQVRIVQYLWKNAKKIDVLNMYHMSIRGCLIPFLIYKFRNKNGKSYLKLDLDYRTLDIISSYSTLKRRIIKILLKNVDIVSGESSSICMRIEELFCRKIELIPNGMLEFKTDLAVCEKDNVFLTVGRLGTEQKATEVLVDSFEQIIDFCDWKLYLVGSCEDTFQTYINKRFKDNPILKDRIVLTGEITDKKVLQSIYKKAKVFILDSRWEGYPLVLPEAMLNGCGLILSEQVPPAFDLIADERYGIIVPPNDRKSLADAMLQSTKTVFDYMLIKKFAMDNLRWVSICDYLWRLINNKDENDKK